MAAALAILLDAPSYHCGTDAVGGADAPAWAAAARAGTTPDWATLLDARGYGSIGDAPACFYWADLAAAYPDATVLLVEREAGPWAASFDAALTAVAPFFRARWRSRLARHAWQICTRMVTPHCPGRAAGMLLWPGSYTHDELVAWYDAHYAAVRAGVPPERLAVVRLGGGWEPLCAALRLPVPAGVDYPHAHAGATNVAAIFEGAAAAMRPPVALVVAAVGASVAAAAAVAVGVWRATKAGV